MDPRLLAVLLEPPSFSLVEAGLGQSQSLRFPCPAKQRWHSWLVELQTLCDREVRILKSFLLRTLNIGTEEEEEK